MSKRSKLTAGFLAGCMMVMTSAISGAESWRGTMDDDGVLWARVKIVNNSAADAEWAIWNCRTAVESTAGTATTEFSGNWDAVVPAGTTEYLWLYGGVAERDESGEVLNVVDLEVGIASSGGAAFSEFHVPVQDGDGELVITVAADGSVSSAVDSLSGAYDPPVRSGS